MKFTYYGIAFRLYQRGSGGRWRLCWQENGKQVERVFRTERDAKAAARRTAKDLNNGTVTVPKDEYELFMNWRKEQEERSGSISLRSAVEKYFNERLFVSGFSKQHIDGTRRRLNAFAEANDVKLEDVNKELIGQYIKSRNGGDITKRNHVTAIKLLLSFCLQEELIQEMPKGISLQKRPVTSVEVIQPSGMKSIVDSWPVSGLILIYLGGAFGIRTEEIGRMRLGHLREDGIVMDIEITKTSKRRLIKYRNVSRERLLELCGERGVTDYIYGLRRPVGNYFSWTAERYRIPWVKNGLRHSYCSYSMAMIGDPSVVSYEAGNSPQILSRNYLNLVTKKDAEDYFSAFR